VHPLINGLSDHDAQVINLSNILSTVPKHLLSYENWEDVFLENNVNIIFNNFLNTYIRICYASFPTIKIQESHKPKPRLTTGIRISCANKRKLYVTYRNSNDLHYKEYYKKYCKILSSVIAASKKMHFDKLILKSTKKTKTTWNIVKSITNNRNTTNNIGTMNINKNVTRKPTVEPFSLLISPPPPPALWLLWLSAGLCRWHHSAATWLQVIQCIMQKLLYDIVCYFQLPSGHCPCL
jgi:hypothetical protein